MLKLKDIKDIISSALIIMADNNNDIRIGINKSQIPEAFLEKEVIEISSMFITEINYVVVSIK